jgi:hypothetical protein
VTIATLRLVALQPTAQRIGKVLPADRAAREVRPEVVAVLGIGHCVSEQVLLASLLAALRGLGERVDLGREGLAAKRAQCAPGVELTTGPVDVAWADVPATEDLVGAVRVGPLGEQAAGRVGELAVADILLVIEGVKLGHNLVGTEVGGLKVAPLSAVLPGPANGRRVGEALVKIAGTSHVLLARALSLEVAVDEGSKCLPRCPAVDDGLCALGLRPALSGGGLVRLRVGLDVIAEVAKGARTSIYTIGLPKVENCSKGISESSVRVRSRALAEELLLELGRCRAVSVEGVVNVLDRGLDVLGAVAETVPVHATVDGLKVERLIDAGLHWGRRSITGVDGIRVLVTDKCGTHGRVRTTNEDPWRLIGSQGRVDVLPLELFGELINIGK